MLEETVLFVDDDRAVLNYVEDIFRGKGCQVVTVDNPMAALEILGSEPVAVLVSDNNMPGMTGLELIAKANEASPETVKIIMTAYSDLSVALCAINQCQVFKFVPKPWKPKEILDAVKNGLRRYRAMQTIRRENEDVLLSLAQTIELKDANTKGHCDRVATYAVQIAKTLGLSVDMQREIKYGGWLHDCGKIGVPEHMLNADRKLDTDEYELMKKHSPWGADVVSKANLSDVVINIVMHHHERYDGSGYPSGLKGKAIPIESRIVAVADVFDAISSDRPYRLGFSRDEAIKMIKAMRGRELDPKLVDILVEITN